jgi:DNA-binding transcriptional LysR family regulator
MDIREMKYIKEIQLTGSFTKAAENLYISQPALSKAVKRIEADLSIRLFRKSGVKNVLTPQGDAIIKLIDPVLEAYQQFEKSIKTIQNNRAFVNFGFTPYYCTPFTTMFLYDFKEAFPDITVNVFEASQDVLAQKILNGEIDVAMTEAKMPSPGIDVFSGFQDDVAIAIGEKNIYYPREKVTFEELKDQTFNMVTNSQILYHQIMNGCLKAGYVPNVGYQSSQISLLLQRTNTEDSICIFNRPMIYDNITANAVFKNLRIVGIEPPPQCYCYVSYQREANMTPELSAFLAHITAALTEDTKMRIQ